MAEQAAAVQKKIELTDDEVRTRAKRLAQLIRDKEIAETKRSEAAKEAKEQIDEMDEEIKSIAKEVRERCRYEEAQMELTGVKKAKAKQAQEDQGVSA